MSCRGVCSCKLDCIQLNIYLCLKLNNVLIEVGCIDFPIINESHRVLLSTTFRIADTLNVLGSGPYDLNERMGHE
jgi:hypothetical protein